MNLFHKKKLGIFTLLLLFLVLFLIGYLSSTNLSFDRFTRKTFQSRVSSNTLTLHYTIENPAAYDISIQEATLGHFTPDETTASLTEAENLQKKLHRFFPANLSIDRELTYDLLSDSLKTELAFAPFYYYQEPLSPISGYPNQLPILLSEYRIQTEQDIQSYFALLSQIPGLFSEILTFEKEKSKQGMFLCDSLASEAASDCLTFAGQTDSNVLMSSFRQRLDQLSTLSAKKKQSYLTEHQRLLSQNVLPAYRMLGEGIQALTGSGTEGGLCCLPKGKQYYLLLLKKSTGSSKSPDQMLKQIEQHRQACLSSTRSLLQSSPSTAIKEPVMSLTSPAAMIEDLKEKITDRFPAASNCNLTLKTVDASQQDTASPAFYMVPPIDHLTENTIYLNPAKTSQPVYIYTTLAHEGYPGHLYQTTLSSQYYSSPLRSLLSYPGFTEGWATYVEYDSYRYLPFEADVAALLQQNNDVILSLYASLDLLIHWKGYRLSEAADFLAGYGITDAATITSIYQAIVAEPVNYLKYYIGYLEILELRDYAKELMRDDFSIKKFHHALIQIGEAPFYIIKKYLPYYLKHTGEI